jgi:hypothetical protein
MKEDVGLWQELGLVFRSKQRPWAILSVIYVLAGTALMVWSAICLLSAGDTRGQIIGAVGFLFGLLIVAFIKLWFFMSASKLVILKAIAEKK